MSLFNPRWFDLIRRQTANSTQNVCKPRESRHNHYDQVAIIVGREKMNEREIKSHSRMTETPIRRVTLRG